VGRLAAGAFRVREDRSHPHLQRNRGRPIDPLLELPSEPAQLLRKLLLVLAPEQRLVSPDGLERLVMPARARQRGRQQAHGTGVQRVEVGERLRIPGGDLVISGLPRRQRRALERASRLDVQLVVGGSDPQVQLAAHPALEVRQETPAVQVRRGRVVPTCHGVDEQAHVDVDEVLTELQGCSVAAHEGRARPLPERVNRGPQRATGLFGIHPRPQERRQGVGVDGTTAEGQVGGHQERLPARSEARFGPVRPFECRSAECPEQQPRSARTRQARLPPRKRLSAFNHECPDMIGRNLRCDKGLGLFYSRAASFHKSRSRSTTPSQTAGAYVSVPDTQISTRQLRSAATVRFASSVTVRAPPSPSVSRT